MKTLNILFGALLCVGIAGCESVEIYDDPENQKDDIRDEDTVSAMELRKAAAVVVDEALKDADFIEFVTKYKQTHNNQRPLMKLTAVRNDTTDTNLNPLEITSFVENQLRKSGKIRITRYEGANRDKSIGASRNNIDDPNFKQSTVAQEGTIEAAVLIMKPYISQNTVRSGRKKRITRTFTIEILTVNGEVIMKCDKQLGFKKTQGAVGW